MVSERKLAANRRNARRSTGPKTPKGKAAVRYNALKHGLLAREVVLTAGHSPEDPAEFDRLLVTLVQELQPVGFLEQALVERIAISHWRLRRVVRAETAEIARRQSLPDEAPPVPPRTDLSVLSLSLSLPGGDAVALERCSSGIRAMLTVVEDALISVLGCGHLSEQDVERIRAVFGTEAGSVRQTCLVYNTVLTNPEILEEHHADILANGHYTPEECARQMTLALQAEHARLCHLRDHVAEREARQREIDQARAALPPPATADHLLRYETAIQRQLYKAVDQLERLQRRRLGDAVPPPVNIKLSHD